MTDTSAATTSTSGEVDEGAAIHPVEAGELNPEAYKALKDEEAATVDGEELATVEVRDQTFKVVANLPGIVLLDLGVASDPSATQGEQLRALREFLKAAIAPDDLGRFEHHLRTAQPTIYIDELNKIVEKLLAVIGGRPTE
jgi:hypothetical protein